MLPSQGESSQKYILYYLYLLLKNFKCGSGVDPGIFARGVQPSEKILTSQKKKTTKGEGEGASVFHCALVNLKICYDNLGNVPNKGRNFNTEKFGKTYLFVICMISRHWFQKKLHLYIA